MASTLGFSGKSLGLVGNPIPQISNCIYIYIPKISSIIRERRLRFAGHIHRHDDQLAHDLLFWSPLHGKRHRGRPNLSYKDVLYTDTGMTLDKLKLVMMDRKKWKETVKCSSLTGDPP